METSLLSTLKTINNVALQPFWYVIYTRPHHEKKIYKILQETNINAFLPLQSSIKQWSDRKKKVIEPLFSCYLFVNITMREYYQVLNVPGVIRFLSFEGKPAVVPEKQIQTIKYILENNFELEVAPVLLQKGSKVEIVFGTLSGFIGELVKYNNKKRVIIKIEEINKSLIINVPLNFLKLVG
jgi:transcriptional antiterminator RfaH